MSSKHHTSRTELVEGVAFGEVAIRTIDKGVCIEDVIEVKNELHLLTWLEGDAKSHKGIVLSIGKTTVMCVL